MRYAFDLTGDGMEQFDLFPEAMASMQVPAEPVESLSLLIWGVIHQEPENDPVFCKCLTADVHANLPCNLYLSGWGIVTFQDIRRFDLTLNPYRPNLLRKDCQFLIGQDDKPIVLSHRWQRSIGEDAPAYLFSILLEQPFGFMSLKINTPAPVRLVVDPRDFVTEDQMIAEPERFTYDLARSRQLRLAEAELSEFVGIAEDVLA